MILRNPSRPDLESGFSLLEVMVALVILAGLSILTAQAMRSGIQSRISVTEDIRREAQLADTIRIIQNDVESAFHHRDIMVAMMNDITNPTPAPASTDANGNPVAAAAATPIPVTPNQALGTPRPLPPVVTGFIGDSGSMYFTSLSNTRVLKDSKESDQGKVGYFLKSCQSRSSNAAHTMQSSQCLYRSFSPYLDEDIATPGPATMLVANVIDFKLRYLGIEKEDYLDTWKTGKDGDVSTKEKFPYAVEVTLTLHDKADPKDKPATAVVLIPIRFPNNAPDKKPAGAVGNGA